MISFAENLIESMKIIKSIVKLLLFLPCFVYAQSVTSEDSMLTGVKPATYVGGYGNFFYQLNTNEKKSEINLERVVLFLGHRFNDKFSFNSELEIEDAKVSGGEEGGEVAIEQAYIKFNLNRNSYLTAGLFLPRIGIMNEDHLPNTFNGNERTLVETYVIPSTWRELGIGFYSSLDAVPIDFSLAIINGLNSSNFEHGTLIREGRYEGRKASGNNLALTGSIQYSRNNFSFQFSAYGGGSVGNPTKESDSLNLDSGPFGTPIMLVEADAKYKKDAIVIKALVSAVSIPDAAKINAAFENNTPEKAYGFYLEASFDFLFNKQKETNNSLLGFVRFEDMNLNASIPENGIDDPVLDQQHIVVGLSYLPIPNIAIKADVRFSKTGDRNPALIVNPDPNASTFNNNNSFINLGVGFSF